MESESELNRASIFSTARNRWLAWFGSHTPSWIETLISPSGIHNYLSSHVFTPFESLFLSNGLRFIPSPSPSQLTVFTNQYTKDLRRGWPRFSRFLLNQLAHDSNNNSPTAEIFIPKFAIASTPTLNSNFRRSELERYQPQNLAVIEDYEKRTRTLLDSSLYNQSHIHTLFKQHRPNISPVEQLFLQRLMSDPSITIKPADKNLGMVMVDTAWYNDEVKKMISDKVTYERYEYRSDKKNRLYSIPSALQSLLKILCPKLAQLARLHTSTLEAWHPQSASQMLRFLTGKISEKTAALPGIYLLIKVHKAKGLCGRPIVPSTRWITTPASILVDHLLQAVLKDARIPWIVKDTKSFVVELESTRMSNQNGVFVTADIASLYTNIDTKMGLQCVQDFLILQQVPLERQRLIMDLLRFVMENSYLTFKDLVYHQKDGTAMGTSVAPTYANIVVYMLERKVITEFGDRLYFYRRFLDDVIVYLCPSISAAFKLRMNSLHPKLLFEFVDSTDDAAFLDLCLIKGLRFRSQGLFDLRVHQKKMNLYLYIPYRSFHTEAAKRSFIQTELMRYIRNSSDKESYLELKTLFYSRLRDRGYPTSFLMSIFNSIFYADRPFFLYPAAQLLDHPLLLIRPPVSFCLQRKLTRMLAENIQGQSSKKQSLPVFVIPYSPLSAAVPTRIILCRHWEYLCTALPLPRPLIAYESLPNLVKQLVYMKAKKEEEQRNKLKSQLPSVQLSIASLFARRPSIIASRPRLVSTL